MGKVQRSGARAVAARQRTEKSRAKAAARWQKHFERQRDLNSKIKAEASDILHSDNFQSTKAHIQHGNMTVNKHCIDVAKCSLAISEKLHIPCNRRELIRGALLHDYFLYDWHSKEHVQPYKLHGFFHPGIALKNASKEYKLTPREKDIIKKHMWPLTVIPPTCREAWIVTTADKWCSLLETLHIHKGHGAKKNGAKKGIIRTASRL
ncbi:MAG: phosphohydrolase [Butyrivibrio sp.]|nr:hypothetical protein [Muribaculum sp.]MCM1551981.1 phosphohydrolase [Butyrivibrio sp.]